ncbi:MAG: formate dehydrogenase accessory sulfurtransferase FdhD [Xanthomonadales bacterium]|nr:formate dehydrogenase accessory sulfurtransferase FdhD [Xanthomonadales bacterium]
MSLRQVPVLNWKQGDQESRNDEIAAEVPVALTYNKRSHVVMMATPTELEDFAVGFSLTEGIIKQPADILDSSVIQREKGLELAITVNQQCFEGLDSQRRNLVGRTGCGLCGAESLDQAMHHPAAVGSRVSINHAALQNAIQCLNDHQPLQAATGALHGAAWCNIEGEILSVREDVGRHNALDKLIGHLSRSAFDPATGFVLVSSRASYEMVYKAAAVGMEILVAVSAPTTLAIDFAHRSGMTLVGFARPGRHNVYTFKSRIHDD